MSDETISRNMDKIPCIIWDIMGDLEMVRTCILKYAIGDNIMMTKKDYIKFADMIALFESDNPNFDADRFNSYIDKKVESLSL